MSYIAARVPYSPVEVGPSSQLDQAASQGDVNREFQRVRQMQIGMFQPHLITSTLSPYTVKATDWLLLADATGGNVNIVFPDAARLDGLFVMVVRIDATVNTVTLTGTFSGTVNPTLAAQYKSKTITAGRGVYYITASV